MNRRIAGREIASQDGSPIGKQPAVRDGDTYASRFDIFEANACMLTEDSASCNLATVRRRLSSPPG